MQATGHSQWFERLLAELGFDLWNWRPGENQNQTVRKQKTDREDARLLLSLVVENRFPKVWAPDPKNRDRRQLRWHRHRLLQMRTRIMNQLQAVALNEGIRRKPGLWKASGRAQLESFLLAP
jgi:transposase